MGLKHGEKTLRKITFNCSKNVTIVYYTISVESGILHNEYIRLRYEPVGEYREYVRIMRATSTLIVYNAFYHKRILMYVSYHTMTKIMATNRIFHHSMMKKPFFHHSMVKKLMYN